jgi:hypothetical protein
VQLGKGGGGLLAWGPSSRATGSVHSRTAFVQRAGATC